MPNANINHVVVNGVTKIDLRADTVTPSSLMSGYTAHDASGAAITGTADTVTGSVYQDEDGYLVVNDDESSAPQGTLSITANGTYDVSDYAGANVQIGGMSETDLKNYIERSGSSFTDIDWPDGLTYIGYYAFASCGFFNPSSLPSSLTSISNYAFYNCSRLSLTSLPNSITNIGDYAFYGCSELALASLPNGITNIRQYSFWRCRKLTLAELPSGITAIGNNAFCGCEGITSISCDGAIASLGTSAFHTDYAAYPSNITRASFPNMALTSNISTAFGSSTASMACQLLEFCDIGSTVGIAAGAFANCYALETLVLRKTASVATLANVSAFTNTPMRGYNGLTGTVYVPSALISSYQTATNWSTLYNDGTVTFVAIEGSEYDLD